MNTRSGPLLCPFFGKCDGLLLFDGTAERGKFCACSQGTAECMCDMILELKPAGLICSFIAELEKQKLSAVGIDIRVGSCSCPVDELVADFSKLPRA